MDFSGDYFIAADRQRVWEALNDPDILARCIDGCQAMRKLSDDHFQAKVKAKVGPVSAAFNLDLTLSDAQPPERYHIDGQVKGGAAGFGKGGADVTLEAEGEGTRLRYVVDASVGGKLAQIGSRLLDGAARKMADEFFATFSEVVTGAAPAPAREPFAGASEEEAQAARATEASQQWVFWLIAFGALGIALVLAL
ncbi:MAG: carbon monoxide dehydrogenase subunit G [Pseudomonadota bacterium]